jgi:hypothetical protein
LIGGHNSEWFKKSENLYALWCIKGL